MYRTVSYTYAGKDPVVITLCEETAGEQFSGDMLFFDANNVKCGALRASGFLYYRVGTMLFGRYSLYPDSYTPDELYLTLGDYRLDASIPGNKRGFR